MSKILMNEGDEYRAKIAIDSADDALFKKVYDNAYSIIKELENHVIRFQKREKDNGIQYRIGNNIIAFCGKRGQGKTSAMQTFSYRLEKQYAFQFYVLKSIDPSALRADESIVRILLSKLFNEFANSMREFARNNRFQDNHEDIQRNRDRILKKFSTCFRNVDYSVKDRKDELGLDDLEQLAELGSSNMLREELQELIKEFLLLQGKFRTVHDDKVYDCNEQVPFLVIQIDDADMALNGVFKICEDIRNYFSLPNVIVLMAADMEQLTNAILQEYIKKYRDIIAVETDDGNKGYYLENCVQMANRYIEKMFPVGHRIELPQIQDFVKWNFNTITLEYYVYDKEAKDCRRNIFAEYDGICKNMHMQEQLLKMLYDRTGLIFLRNEQNLHYVLPRTMRELTHFVKMLQNMPPINFEAAFQEQGDDAKGLRNNLDIFENYFYNYWCANHLKERQQILFRKMHEELFINEPSADDIIKMCRESDKDLRSAYVIIYSIFLNKKFIEAVGRQDLGTNLAVYLEDFILSWDTEDLKFMKYRYDPLGSWKLEDNDKNRDIKEIVKFPFISEDGIFDAAKAILNYENSAREEESTSTSSLGENEQGNLNAAKDKPGIWGWDWYAIGLKNLFGNLDVYLHITEQIEKVYAGLNIYLNKFYTLTLIYKEIFEIMNIDKMVDCLGIKNIEINSLGSYWYSLYLRGKDAYLKCFWANGLNKERFENLNKALLDENKKVLENIYDKTLHNINDNNLDLLEFGEEGGKKAVALAYDEVFGKSDSFQKLERSRNDLNDVLENFNEKIHNQGKIEESDKKRLLRDIKHIRNRIRTVF